MEVSVGEQRRNRGPLWGPFFARRPYSPFEYSGLQPLSDESEHPLISNPMLDKSQHPIVIYLVKVTSNIRIEYPTYLLEADCGSQYIKRHVRSTSRSKSVREAEEVHLVDGAEHFRHGTLENLVLQGHDPQWPLSAIRFRNVCSSRRLCSVRSAMHPTVQILEMTLQVCLVVLPCHSVYSRCSVSVYGQKRVAQPFDGDVVKERAESLVLVPFCCRAHTVQRIRHA